MEGRDFPSVLWHHWQGDGKDKKARGKSNGTLSKQAEEETQGATG